MYLKFLLVLASSWALVHSTKDNIIFILADDLGWNDVSIHGMNQFPTPNIEALAAHGVVLSNYYGAPMCTPSRAAFMTGRYPSRIGLQHYVIPENGPWGLPTRMPTLADRLNELGYVSRLLGKWHLGFYKSEYLPLARGFKSHFGFWTGNFDFSSHTSSSQEKRENYINLPDNCTDEIITFVGHNLRDDINERKDLDGQYITDLLTTRAIDIISSHNVSNPLFLLLAHHAPHRGNIRKPMTAPEKYTKPFDYIKDEMRKNFAGAVNALDQSVGAVVNALAAKDMLKNSLIVFASDNGADTVGFSANSGSNWPLRGQKVTAWEGGVRIPAVIWSPRIQNAGRIWNGLMHVSDWLPTLYRFAGSEPSTIPDMDGYDMWGPISENLSSARNEILLISDPLWNMSALRVGDFKLVKGSYPGQDLNGWYGTSGRDVVSHTLETSKSTILKLLGGFSQVDGPSIKSPKIHVNCGNVPTRASQRCNPTEDVCVFNIKDDPCEYRNLGGDDKELVQRLLARLREYEEKDVSPLNTKRDYLANPALHGGSWVPWSDFS